MSLTTKEREHKRTAPFAAASRAINAYKRRGWQAFYEEIRTKTSVYHINDCADADAAEVRLKSRSSELIGRNEGFAAAASDLEAGGLLIDLLDGLDGATDPSQRRHQNVVLVNVAPRNGEAKRKHENGTPFGYSRYNGTLIVSTVDGYALAFLKKFGITGTYKELDTRATLATLNREGQITDEEEKRVGETQFRSYEFSPRVASYLLRRKTLDGVTRKLSDTPEVPEAIWFVDKFGNLKTTLLPEEVFPEEIVAALKPKEGVADTAQVTTLKTAFGELPVYRRLKDVPDSELAVIVGSSGSGDKRLLEIVVQGASAAKQLDAKVGTLVRAQEESKEE